MSNKYRMTLDLPEAMAAPLLVMRAKCNLLVKHGNIADPVLSIEHGLETGDMNTTRVTVEFTRVDATDFLLEDMFTMGVRAERFTLEPASAVDEDAPQKFMPVDKALEIVFELASLNALQPGDVDLDLMAEANRQQNALAVVHDFLVNVVFEGRL